MSSEVAAQYNRYSEHQFKKYERTIVHICISTEETVTQVCSILEILLVLIFAVIVMVSVFLKFTYILDENQVNIADLDKRNPQMISSALKDWWILRDYQTTFGDEYRSPVPLQHVAENFSV